MLKIWGWKLTGESPAKVNKFILLPAPHTSAWDFIIGVLSRGAWGFKVNFVGKQSLFDGPFGFFFKWMGGHPIDRSKNNNSVESIAQLFLKNERFAIMLAPEGTRKKVEKLKTGFFFIAKKAKVPVILVKINAKDKILHFSPARTVKETVDEEMQYIWNYFKGVEGFNPEMGIT